MNASSIVLLCLLVVLIIACVIIVLLDKRINALEAESNVLETKLANRDAEIAHLRTHQAAKIDRALTRGINLGYQ